ncbi:MAG: hemerythrin domain-containing protein [Endomicrobiales bacterium]|jgi:hemerythrin-like domain-containing protein
MTAKNIINILYETHDDIKEKIIVMKDALKILDTDTLRTRKDDIISFFNTHLNVHFKKEEILIATTYKYHTITPKEQQILAEIISEHVQLLNKYKKFIVLSDQVDKRHSQHNDDFILVFYDILDTLLKHAEKEDTLVYPILQKYLDATQLKEALQCITSAPAIDHSV